MRVEEMTVLLLLALGTGAAWGAPRYEVLNTVPADRPFLRIKEVRQITEGPKHHFFGYYGMPPWNASEKRMVFLQTDFSTRPVEETDQARICLMNMEDGQIRQIASTNAWNFQQGALLHWLPTDPESKIVYNDRVDGALCAVVRDLESGETRRLPRPIAAMSHSGKWAASINYARLADTRPGYGYVGVPDPFADAMHPADDGLYVMDLETGEYKLIVSMDQAFHAEKAPEEFLEKKMWFNHVLFSRDDSRIFFMARYKQDMGPLVTAAFTVNPDGTELRCVLPYSWGASHYDWLDGRRMVVSSRYQAGTKWLHVFFTDGGDDYAPFAPEVLQRDGHCHFSWDGQWMVTDSYPQGRDRMRSLYLMDMATQQVAELARFHEPEEYKGEWRCDLHPRWNRTGNQICIDAASDGTRQIYIVALEKTGGE